MRFVGIDPGLRITGYAAVELPPGAVDPRLVEAGVVRLDERAPIPVRLRALHEELGELLDELRPSRIAVEQVFAHVRHVGTAIVMGHGRGVVLLAAALRDLPVDELAPAEVKKAITGRGQATKEQVQRAVMRQFSLRVLPEPPDVADAIAIAACAARRHADVQALRGTPSPRR